VFHIMLCQQSMIRFDKRLTASARPPQTRWLVQAVRQHRASFDFPDASHNGVPRQARSLSIRLKKLALKLTEETYSRVTTQSLLEQAVEDLLRKHGL
jgi:hypothetical protein